MKLGRSQSVISPYVYISNVAVVRLFLASCTALLSRVPKTCIMQHQLVIRVYAPIPLYCGLLPIAMSSHNVYRLTAVKVPSCFMLLLSSWEAGYSGCVS